MRKFEPIKRQLEDTGWRVTPIELPIDVWWAFEIWELRSIWRPVDKTIYLSLMLNPMNSTSKETDVWSINLSKTVPTNRLYEDFAHEIGIVRKFSERWPEVIRLASELRDK